MNSNEELYDDNILKTSMIYYTRDLKMNINNNETIIKHLKKLGYYNFNIEKELYDYHLNILLNKIKNDPQLKWYPGAKNITLNINIEENKTITSIANRADVLMKYSFDTDTFSFYNNLTLDELESLGY